MSQLTTSLVLKVEDFDKYQWMEILDQANPKYCWGYSEKFRARAEDFQLSGDTLGQEIFKFLSEISSVLMEPFGLKDTSIAEENMLAVLSDDHLALLRKLVLTVSS